MKVPLLDLKAQYGSIKTEIDNAVAEVFASQHFILGPKVKECEDAVAKYCHCEHGVSMSSGTDALLSVLMAENIGPGDEVITSPYTFFATAGSIARVGAKPVFVDIDPVTFNIDPELIERRVTKRTRAIMPVHLYGQMTDMAPIMKIARKHKLVVIEDAAQAIGAEHKGKRAGSIGHYGCLSFFPSKNLGGAGDGGMVVTNDEARAKALSRLRNHGAEPKYYHKVIGGNFRLDALQAAVITVKLRHLDKWTAGRQANAARYDRLFKAAGLAGEGRPGPDNLKPEAGRQSKLGRKLDSPGVVGLPKVAGGRHVFNQYVVRVPRRDELRAFLDSMEVGNEVYYPVPLHRQECFKYLGYREGACPESEKAGRETLALPVYPELTDVQAKYVVECIGEFYRKSR